MTRVITVTSGKGGVGKTSICLNLALAMAEKGFSTAVFDADLGLANINILTGIYPEKHLMDVIDGRCELKDIIIRNYQGIDIIPGSTGVEMLADLDRHSSHELITSFLSFASYDYIFFDTSGGISTQVLSFCMASNEIYLIITTQPTSITDAYSMLKVLSGNGYENSVQVILNQVDSEKQARRVYTQLNNTVKRFLSISLKPIGLVVEDKHVGMAVVAQTPFVMLFPDSKASRCVKAIADKIGRQDNWQELPLSLFWDRCFSFLSSSFKESPSNDRQKNDQYPKKEVLQDALNKRLDNIESSIFELVEQFNCLKKLIEDKGGNKAVVLDFESWLHKH